MKITYPKDGAVLNELTVKVVFETQGINWVYRLDGKPEGWARAGNGFQILFNLSPGTHTFEVLNGCLSTNGGVETVSTATVTFTIDVFSTTTLQGNFGSTTTSTTSTTLQPPDPPTVGSTNVDASLAPNKRVHVSVGGTLVLPAGVDAALACVGDVEGTATYKKLAPVSGLGSLSPAGNACTFDVGFDLLRKVLRHKVVFDFSFPGNDRLGGLDFSKALKVKKAKKL